MRHILLQTIRLAPLVAALTFSLQLRADEPIPAEWNQLCRVANGRELLLTTSTGETVNGYCVSVNVDQLTVTTDQKRMVRIARTALTKLAVHRSKGHQLASLGRGMNDSLSNSFRSVFSPMAPVGLVALPATLAWGAAAAPFCLLGDLHYKLAGARQIKLN
jgi:hypothetical protein